MNRLPLLRTSLLASVVALMAGLGLATPAAGAVIIVPNSLAGVEGNTENGFPFNIAFFGLGSQRYQQVFGASQFSSLSGPEFITQFAFRPDFTFGSAFSSTLPSVQINLSTTLAAPDALSTTFSANVGVNDTMVFNGPLSLSSSNTGSGPRNFDIIITLSTPFLYDPTAGNLLLDVRNFGGGSTTQFDAHNAGGDSISRLFSSTVTDLTGFSDSFGLVTRFTTEAPAPPPNNLPAVDPASVVPEPSSLALLTSGLIGLGGYCARHRRNLAPVV